MDKKFTTSNNYDVLRLIFACLVFLYHSTVLFGYTTQNIIFNMSGIAVQGFFTISGFLIFWSFDKNNNVIQYITKRFFRIYPLYFVLIIVQAILLNILAMPNLIGSIKYLLCNFLFLNFLSPSIGNALQNLNVNAINGSLWTLKIEVIFYLIVPVIYYLYKKWGYVFLITLYLISSLYFLFIHNHFLLTLFPNHLRFFISGILLYLYGGKIVDFLKNKSFIILFLLAALLIASVYIDARIFKSFIYPITLGLSVLIMAFCIPYKKLKLDISYSVYVLHFPIMQILILLKVFNNYALFLLLSGLVLFVLSGLSAIIIEQPAIKLGHRLSNKFNSEKYNLLQKTYWMKIMPKLFLQKLEKVND